MARNINGGTDTVLFTGTWPFGGSPSVGCIAFRMKTTQATASVATLSLWNSSSRNGFGFILNNGGSQNKILGICYDISSPQKVTLVSTSSVNDGNWHSVALNWNGNSGQANTLFIDGTQEATANASADWSITGLSIPLALGDPADAFWASYVGDIAEVAIWSGRQLTADEQVAYAKGFSPKLIAPDKLEFYAPLVQTVNDRMGLNSAGSATGTTVSDQPRVLG